jgi:hypothetical protein
VQNKSNKISDAVVLFLGFGSASSPRRDHAGLVQEFGATEAGEIESQVISLLEDVGKIKVNWTAHSLESAGEMARTEMYARHPDLSGMALRALVWSFTFDWR